MLKSWRSGQLALIACVAAVICGCAMFSNEPTYGGPPPDSYVMESIASDPGHSLAMLSDHDFQTTASADTVIAEGWAKALRRLGLPCHKDALGTTLESATPDGIPFTIDIVGHPVHPGNPHHQFQVTLAWGASADVERGKRGLLALDSKQAVKG